MTYAQILSAIQFRVWGNSNPPANSTANLQSMIQQCCNRLQDEYNYWFMHSWGSVIVTAASQGYNLPARCKEVISMMWALDEGGYSSPLCPVIDTEAHSEFWPQDAVSTAEYPGYYEIVGDSFILYPDPVPDPDNVAAEKTLIVVYWGKLVDIDNFTTYTDTLSDKGADVLINMVASEMLMILGDTDKAQMFEAAGQRALGILKKYDYKHRQENLSAIPYGI